MILFKKAVVLFSFITVLFLGIEGQNLEDVVSKHIKARGGLKKWNKVKTIKITGTYIGFSVPKPFVIVKQKPSSYSFVHHLGEKPVKVGFDGKTMWKSDMWNGTDFPFLMNDAQFKTWVQLSDFATPFFNYKKKGYKVELIGKEKVDGKDCFKLKLTRKCGSQEIWFLDSKTYLEYSRESAAEDFGRGLTQVTFFDDFRRVNGLKIPFAIESEFSIRHRVFEVDKVEINPVIDKKLFKRPVTENMQKLGFMEGEWDVNLDFFSRRQNKYVPVDKFSTTIKSDLNGELMEEKVFRNKMGNAHWVHLRFYFDRSLKKYALSEFNSGNSTTRILNGAMEGDKIIFAGKPDEKAPRTERITFKKIDGKSFELLTEVSPKGSDKWFPMGRLTYKKR